MDLPQIKYFRGTGASFEVETPEEIQKVIKDSVHFDIFYEITLKAILEM